ncbi:Uncharacterised protein [Mycobacteroides abscessus subsp. abscessus]|nr:Uncharacterised protein [Mycobacteroides abscessus subsp. abscessus]
MSTGSTVTSSTRTAQRILAALTASDFGGLPRVSYACPAPGTTTAPTESLLHTGLPPLEEHHSDEADDDDRSRDPQRLPHRIRET